MHTVTGIGNRNQDDEEWVVAGRGAWMGEDLSKGVVFKMQPKWERVSHASRRFEKEQSR